ncbi:hypothetical protein A2690_00390 [Candidatus Roizmanbacteria bacterium RIFCSPHIGHO2_01_FULL_39_12b]|uniref:Amine oxidase domain-containing protein n=1 Tax=Candidatus Roizmanbacteria bacterium RIFCSPHIGHO2_01_FULL_39_12b TaxID=1802030 RepID=A0A1F7G9B7_9BACT|nr:MAG: hypothetical protein A2690_00390 [Candidatus Roizmanbacteria bacterium RIFCSPHIGHO2_01_FULL_39_12b]OGK46025.1 MAG: hypothetical protein A3B46_00680 [Candidatus Roizmanbacteria bacterium RIFCSPLOWO2_01_FULL_39_19]
MKIAILGGGFSGLACAFDASNKHDVVVYERSSVLGGLASGFFQPHWEWPVERAYHHLFANDTDIINFARDTGFNGIYFSTPTTASLFEVSGKYETTPFDTPADLLRFRHLDVLSKLRTATILAALKLGPNIPIYERMGAHEFMTKTTGERSWNILWEQLFRKKFGKYAENILMSFLWARIHKRTKRLGYIRGGFQTFINHIEKALNDKKVHINKKTQILSIKQNRGEYEAFIDQSGQRTKEKFDAIVSTLPSPILPKVTKSLFDGDYLGRFSKLRYLNALALLLETKQPILDDIYWLNICTPSIPMMLIGQHTNFVDKKHYGGNHLSYIGYYLEASDPLVSMKKEELIKALWPYLEKINPKNKENKILKSFSFYGPYAQPLFEKDFLKYKPDFVTPKKNFYVANLDMTYPYDRGTNYAVKLGRIAASLV